MSSQFFNILYFFVTHLCLHAISSAIYQNQTTPLFTTHGHIRHKLPAPPSFLKAIALCTNTAGGKFLFTQPLPRSSSGEGRAQKNFIEKAL